MRPECFRPSPLTLGTVQLGLHYGVANATGMPDEATAKVILDAALAGGITTLDTARSYGAAEEIIGQWLRAAPHGAVRVVTKLPAMPLDGRSSPRAFVEAALKTSSALLGRRPLDLVLAHRGEDLLDGSLVAVLEEAVTRGDLRAFGASVYSPDVALQILNEVPIAALQVPLSVVDRRFLDAGVVQRAQAMSVRVFARSVLLQGSLMLSEQALPRYLSALIPAIRALRAAAAQSGLSPLTLAVRAIIDTPGIASTVIGIERPEQLQPHLAAASAPPLTNDLMKPVYDAARDMPAAVLDPSRWPSVAA
jgi:aryl-alcohol dehydrogenase-like predicted oxidoreductase